MQLTMIMFQHYEDGVLIMINDCTFLASSMEFSPYFDATLVIPFLN